jgi:hypothetical protein
MNMNDKKGNRNIQFSLISIVHKTLFADDGGDTSPLYHPKAIVSPSPIEKFFFAEYSALLSYVLKEHSDLLEP